MITEEAIQKVPYIRYREIPEQEYDYIAAINFVNNIIKMHNAADNIKGYQKAVLYFLSNCHKVGIIYEDR